MRPSQSAPHLEHLTSHPHFQVVLKILKTLREQGYQTVLAGGCVRDSLLGITPKDLDIATAAPPEIVEKSFQRTLAVGKAFGTIVVVEDGHNFEVTTFRKDGEYKDSRHPEAVEFSDIEEDAKRRDFTVNALFYDPITREVLDYVDGVQDLHACVLRTVGEAELRFGEDRLRMLRAVRFVAQLGFQLDSKALKVIQQDHEEIKKVSNERIFAEMKRLLESNYAAEGLETLRKSKLEADILPEIKDVQLELFSNFMPVRSWENGFAALMLLSGTSDVEPRLRQWKVSRDSLRKIQAQLEGCKTVMNPASTRADRAKVLGSEHYADILTLAQGFLPGNITIIEGWIQEFLEVTAGTGNLPKPFINGQDLLSAGFQPGEEMGTLLKTLYEAQLEGEVSSKDDAIEKLKSLALT